jgi:hypothetical protein
MVQSSTTHLDAAMFEQALAVLDRERPSPREDRLFNLLYVLVWSVVGLTALYLLLRLRGFPLGTGYVWIARAVALLYILILPVLFVNSRLVQKLRRAARLRRRLSPTFKRRLADHFKARRHQHQLINLATLALGVIGQVIAVLGFLGLFFQLLPDDSPINPARFTFFLVAGVFGVSCVSLHFIARGRERLDVIADLRASLLASRNDANESQLTAEEYDEVTRIERLQIAADRRQSVRAATDTTLARTYSLKEHRGVRDAKLALPPDILVKVQDCIDRLKARPGDVDEVTQERGGIFHIRVPDTTLELGLTIDWHAREIKLLLLGPQGRDMTSAKGSEGSGK